MPAVKMREPRTRMRRNIWKTSAPLIVFLLVGCSASEHQIEVLRKRAERGLPDAQTQLGLAYDSGEGVPKDPAIAAEWYRKAAEQGYAEAQHNLAVSYYHGEGVPKDFARAAEWFRKAAEQGYAAAQYNLGPDQRSGPE